MSPPFSRQLAALLIHACLLSNLILLSACGLEAPRSGVVLSTVEGISVAAAVFEVRANHTDIVRVHVLFPSDSSGGPIRPSEPRPAMVFIQGGLVETQRYFWLGERLARQGFIVAYPEFPYQLALLSEETGMAARELLTAPPEGSLLEGQVDASRIGVGGHSLGGVVSVDLSLKGGFAFLVLLASYPKEGVQDLLPDLKLPSVSIAGENDCNAGLTEVKEGAAALPSPTALAVLSGVTHYQFTDSDAEDVEAGCVADASLNTAHDRTEGVLLAFLEAALQSEPGTGAEVMANLEGVEVESR